ncbi:MAG: hypothetical protein KDH96_08175 [Candidatus Riesia sp.]|nr:hypothetical protein [Candidatus Riesia sp.]
MEHFHDEFVIKIDDKECNDTSDGIAEYISEFDDYFQFICGYFPTSDKSTIIHRIYFIYQDGLMMLKKEVTYPANQISIIKFSKSNLRKSINVRNMCCGEDGITCSESHAVMSPNS